MLADFPSRATMIFLRTMLIVCTILLAVIAQADNPQEKTTADQATKVGDRQASDPDKARYGTT